MGVRTLLSTKLRQTCRERFAHLFSSLLLGATSLLRHAMALGMHVAGGSSASACFRSLWLSLCMYLRRESMWRSLTEVFAQQTPTSSGGIVGITAFSWDVVFLRCGLNFQGVAVTFDWRSR